MKRAAALVLAASLLTSAPAAADEATMELESVDTSRYPLLVLSIRVRGPLAREPLQGAEFSLFEGDRRISASVWTFEDEPLEVALVMDTSGSMDGAPIADARTAAAQFAERLPEGAEVGVVVSGGGAAVLRDFGDEGSPVGQAIDGLSAEGETALYDAVVTATSLFVEAEAHRVVVVLSDGGDTVSSATLAEAAAAITASGAEVHVVALNTDEADRAALQRLAQAGRGTVVAVDDAQLLSTAYEGVAADLAGRYRLVYNTGAAGPVRLTVSILHNGETAWSSIDVDLPGQAALSPAPFDPAGSEEGPEMANRAPAAGRATPPPLLGGAWAFPVGIAVVLGGVLAVAGLVLSDRRTAPRPIAPRRRRKLLSFLSRGAESAADHLLRKETAGSLDRALDRAGVNLRPGEFVVLAGSAAIATVAAGVMALGPIGGIIVGALALAVPRFLLRVLTQRRRAAFADQFEGALQMISGSLRAGYGLLQAVATVASEAPSPTGDEFGRVTVENQLGRSVEEALVGMADRMDNEDLRWVVDAIEIQYEVGGDLAEVLDSVAETIRDRNQIRRQVKALSAEGRISAIILVSLPFAIAGLINLVSPDYLAELTGSTVGRIMILGAFLLIGIGSAWIRRIVKVVF